MTCGFLAADHDHQYEFEFEASVESILCDIERDAALFSVPDPELVSQQPVPMPGPKCASSSPAPHGRLTYKVLWVAEGQENCRMSDGQRCTANDKRPLQNAIGHRSFDRSFLALRRPIIKTSRPRGAGELEAHWGRAWARAAATQAPDLEH